MQDQSTPTTNETQALISQERIDLFWSHVHKGTDDECWSWTGYCNKCGYGVFRADDKGTILAHRFAWQIANGPIPTGFCIAHTCDNPRCCYLAHLWLATQKQNMADMAKKGRGHRVYGDDNPSRKYPERILRGDNHPAHLHPEKMARGEATNHNKLTAENVLDIRLECEQLGDSPESRRLLAAKWKVTDVNIREIVRGNTWKHVGGPRFAANCHTKAFNGRSGIAWQYKHPEKVIRGDQHHAHLHPETRQGEKNGRHKVTADDVRTIRQAWAMNPDDEAFAKITATIYNVDRRSIRNIVMNRTWTNLV